MTGKYKDGETSNVFVDLTPIEASALLNGRPERPEHARAHSRGKKKILEALRVAMDEAEDRSRRD